MEEVSFPKRQLPHSLAADKAVYAQDLLTATQNCYDFLRTQLEDISARAFSRDFFAPSFEDFTTTTHREAQEVVSYYFNRTQEVLQAKRKLTQASFLSLYNVHMEQPTALALDFFPTASEIPLHTPVGMQVASFSDSLAFYPAEPRTFKLLTST